MHLLFRFAPRAARTCTQRVYRSSGFDAFVIATRRERERERRRDRIAAASEETTPLIICMSRLVTKSYGHDRNFSLAEEKHRDYDRRKRKRGFASPSDLSVKNHPFINFHPSRIKEKGKRKIVVLEPRAPAATWPPATLRCLNV